MENKKTIVYLVIFMMLLQAIAGGLAFAQDQQEVTITNEERLGGTNINKKSIANNETSFKSEDEGPSNKYLDEGVGTFSKYSYPKRDISHIVSMIGLNPSKPSYNDGDKIEVKVAYNAGSTKDIKSGDFIRVDTRGDDYTSVAIFNKGRQGIYLTDSTGEELEVGSINVVNDSNDYLELVFNENIEKIDKSQVVGNIDFTILVRNSSTKEEQNFKIEAGKLVEEGIVNNQEEVVSGETDTVYYKTGDMQPDMANELRWFLSFMPSNVKKAVYGPVVIVDELENKDAHEIIEDSIQLTINVAGNYKTYKKEDINPNNNDLYSTGIDLRQVSLYSTKDRIELSIPDYVAGDSKIESLQVYYKTKILKDVEEFGNSSYLRFSNSPDIENNKIVSNGRVRNINFGGTISAVPRQLIIEKYLEKEDYNGKFENARIPGVEFEILKDGEILDFSREDLTTNTRGLISISNLEPGSYEVREKNVLDGMVLNPESQKFTIGENDSRGVVLKFKNKIKRKNIKIKKEWLNEDQEPLEDLEDNSLVKPISVVLKAKSSSGEKLIGKYELNNENNWSFEIENLLAYYIEDLEAGILGEYEFILEEEAGEAYMAEIIKILEDDSLNFLVRNTIVNEETKLKAKEISLIKNWIGNISGSISEISLSIKEKGKTIKDNIILRANEEWKKLVKIPGEVDLDNLEVEEDGLEGYISIVEKNDAEFLITNIESLDIDLKKVWIGDAEKFKESIRVYLVPSIKGERIRLDDLRSLGLEIPKDSIILSEENNWESSFKNLAKYTKNREEIHYTVEEEILNNKTYPVVTGSMEEGYLISNYLREEEKVNLEIEKKWEIKDKRLMDEIGEDLIEIEVQLLKNGENHGEPVRLRGKIGDKPAWKYTFDGLDRFDTKGDEINYSVVETKMPSWVSATEYDYSTKGKVLINNISEEEARDFIRPKMDLDVKKEWILRSELGREKYKNEVKDIEVELLVDGEASGKTLVLNEDNNWKASFKDLDKFIFDFKDGRPNIIGELDYSIRENTSFSWIEVEILGGPSKGFTLVNKEREDLPPEKPKEPNKPEKPEKPSKPEKPEEPSKPEKPEEPSKPEKPEEPSRPEKPEEPSKPEKPEETIDQDFKGIVAGRDPIEELVEEKPEELPKTGVANTSLNSLIGIIILGLGAAFIKEK